MKLRVLNERGPVNTHYHGWTRKIYYEESFDEDSGTETITFHVNSNLYEWKGNSWDADKVIAKLHKDVSRKFRQLIYAFADTVCFGSDEDSRVEDIEDYFVKTFNDVNGSEIDWNRDLGMDVKRILRICGFKPVK